MLNSVYTLRSPQCGKGECFEELDLVLTATFPNEFANYIEMKVLCKELLLLGDFSIRVDAVDDIDATKFSDLLESLGLVQHVEHAKHVHGHTLDLIISRKWDTTIYAAPRIDRFLSDHGAVHFTINSNRPNITVKTVSFRKLISIVITQPLIFE